MLAKLMERFYKRKAPEPNSNAIGGSPEDDINWEEEIKYDPGLRKLIDEYHPNQRERGWEENICRMDHRNLAHAVFHAQKLEEVREDLFQNGLMSLEVGLNTVNPKTELIVFVASCLEIRKILDMTHLLLLVGMAIIENKG
jgi:hypothetical protein